MVLKNLALEAPNVDGSTTLYGALGNAIEDIYSAHATTVFADPLTPLVTTTTPVWYAPARTDQYFQNLLDNPQFFDTIGGIKVFRMYLGMVTWPDDTLKAFFNYLSARNIPLAVEASALVADPGQPGAGIEGFSPTGSMVWAVSRLQSLGATLSYVSWDEPAYFGSILTGYYTLSQVAAQVATSVSAVRAIFPNVKVTDTEPVDAAMNGPATLQAWFDAYAKASGSQFSSFLADTNTGSLGWQSNLANTIAMAHADSIPVGVIVDGFGAAATDAAWSATATANAMQILSDPALRPDYLDVQSWLSNPSETADANTAGTLASVAADITAGESAALSVPAVAHYSSAGILRSVTWTGGWTASQNGSSLVFTSPTGTVVSHYAWGDVRVFAFEPDTGTLSLTVLSPSGATSSNQPEQDTSYAVNVAAGQFVFASVNADSAPAGALTLELAAASTTGFAGSGITNQSTPTLTGTGTPNSTIQLQVDGSSAGSAVVSATGAWTFAIANPLTSGAHLIKATGGTTPGAGSQQSYVVSVEATQRLSPTLGLAAGSDTGYPGDQITDVTQPVLSGVDDPGVAISVAIDGLQVGNTTTDANGNWTYTPSSALADGTHTITVNASGPPGTSPAPATMLLTIDTATQEAAMASSDPLFDPAWYIQQHPGIATTADAAYAQYMTTGWQQGNDPSPFFSTSYYLNQYPDVAAAGMNPLRHFETYGWKEGRNPSSTFNTQAYEAAHPGLPAGQDPLVAYINNPVTNTPPPDSGSTSSDPLFDAAWYLQQHPGIATSDLAAYTQYMTTGWKLGYDPSPYFSTTYYLDCYPDVAAAGMNPLQHFETYGWKEGRNPSSTFNTVAYEAAHPGLPAGQDPLVAYINSLNTSGAPASAPPAAGMHSAPPPAITSPAGEYTANGTGGDASLTANPDATINLALSPVQFIAASGDSADTTTAGAANNTLNGGSGTNALINNAGGFLQDFATALNLGTVGNLQSKDLFDDTNLIPGGAAPGATASPTNIAAAIAPGPTSVNRLIPGSFTESGFTLIGT